MKQLSENHSFVGMQRDLSVSKHQAQFLYDGHNIRLTSREDDTLLAITNEKGTLSTGVTVEGSYLGHCLLNNYLVVFSVKQVTGGYESYITRIDLTDCSLEELFGEGDLGFRPNYPIDAIASFENNNVQKIYWTDNLNQPRVINIAPSNDSRISSYTSTSFDFIPELQLRENVTVKKLVGASGEFAPGVIQYAFTYYNKYGQESNIFWTTSLLYISYSDRGASPEDKVDNAFQITINNIDKDHFEYIRIYSIQRSSINATPFVKRIQDISLKDVTGTSVTYTDTGMSGNDVDPTEILYKGGEPIIAKTLEQKDNTLFLGNIKLDRPQLNDIKSTIVSSITSAGITCGTRSLSPFKLDLGSYSYSNQLCSLGTNNVHVPCAGFKHGDVYRLGVQFQHKSGRWSDPIHISDELMSQKPSASAQLQISLPVFNATVPSSLATQLWDAGYRKVRALVVYPEIQDRNVVCQGVLNPTLYTQEHRSGGDIYAQSSWFFRPTCNAPILANTVVSPKAGVDGTLLDYTHRGVDTNTPDTGCVTYNPSSIRSVEIQGEYDDNHKFRIDNSFCTLHSPDIEFDDSFYSLDYNGLKYQQVGNAVFSNTMSDIDIQTDSPTISNSGSGFFHQTSWSQGPWGFVAGLFYDDYIVSDFEGGTNIERLKEEKASAKWLIYPWHKKGSLNNDINRPEDKGKATAVLNKKVMSNLRYANTDFNTTGTATTFTNVPQLFSSDETTIIKVGSSIYCGNIDTALTPDRGDGVYYAWNGGTGETAFNITKDPTPFDSTKWFKTLSYNDDVDDHNGLFYYKPSASKWEHTLVTIGTDYVDLVIKKELVRMRYKSTPHIVCEVSNSAYSTANKGLAIMELQRVSVTNRFGGNTPDALKENIWIPCGDPVNLVRSTDSTYQYSWGDTYFQRYDCLKTYPFSREDPNQIVEIGSFMLETHTNIDGRYDRNRGQMNNLNMSPINFNLINPVYSQLNNFFTYKILDDDFYNSNEFPNQITWTKEKQSGADTDLWTNITLASTYDMDGSKGEIVSINSYKDLLYCFQNKGVSNILFNSRVQIPTSDGLPIEISNSYKVDGYRYISDGIGCNSQRLIKEAPTGIYFIDSVSNHLFQLGDTINDVTLAHNMGSVFSTTEYDKVLYDALNRDVYLVNGTDALCYSEILNQFTGFMDYEDISLIENYASGVFTMKDSALYKMFSGDYNYFFDSYKPWHFTFVSNALDQGLQDIDKVFSNIEYRMDVQENGSYQHFTSLDYIKAANEYQDTGEVNLTSQRSTVFSLNNTRNGNLQKKFRTWRIQIPRDGTKKLDRIRNTWCRITLGKKNVTNQKAVLHDLNVIYYI